MKQKKCNKYDYVMDSYPWKILDHEPKRLLCIKFHPNSTRNIYSVHPSFMDVYIELAMVNPM